MERGNQTAEEWHPLNLLDRLLTHTIEQLYDESLNQESWYKSNWQQCIHLLRRLIIERHRDVFLSVWHLQSLRAGQNHVAEDIEQYFFSAKKSALLYVHPPFPQKKFAAVLETNQPTQRVLFTQKLLIVQTQHGEVSVWDIETHRRKWTTKRSVCIRSFATSEMETSVALMLENQLQLVHLHTGSTLQTLSRPSVCAIALSEEEEILAAGDLFGHIHCWDIASQQWLYDIASKLSNIVYLHFLGQRLLVADGDGTLQCWVEERLLWTQILPTLHVTSCTHSADERVVCIGSYDGSVVTVDCNTGRIVEHSLEYTKGIDALHVDPSGTLLHCASKNGELFQKALHLESTLLRTISEEKLCHNAIHPNGKCWASGYSDGRIYLRSIKEENVFLPKMSIITALNYCTESRIIYCGDILGRVYLWTDQGEFIRSIPSFPASIQSLAAVEDQLFVHLQSGETFRNRNRLPLPRIQSKFSLFDSNNRCWFFLSWDGEINVFSVDGTNTQRHPHQAPLTAWSMEADVLCLGFATGDVLLYNWSEDRILEHIHLPSEASAVSVFKNSLFAVSQCGTAILWENDLRWKRQLSLPVTTALHKDNKHVFVCTAEEIHLLAEQSYLPLPISSQASLTIRVMGERLLVAIEDQLCILRATLSARSEQKLQ